VRSNVIKNITGTAKDGISVNSGSGHKIQGNWIETIADGHGINSGMPECEFVGNTVKDIGTPSTRYAIACTGDRCKVNGNTTETGLAGIFQTGDDFQVNDNDCDGGTRGIRVDSCVDGTIVGNLVRNSTNEGIYINAVTDAAVTGNRSHGNTYGIRSAGASDYLAVIGNSCRGNSTSAITLVGSNNVNTGNT
jgi:parallel beta-helix repeat protein